MVKFVPTLTIKDVEELTKIRWTEFSFGTEVRNGSYKEFSLTPEALAHIEKCIDRYKASHLSEQYKNDKALYEVLKEMFPADEFALIKVFW